MIVGIKQTLRMLEQGKITEIFVARDADFYVTRNVLEAAKAARIPIHYVESMKKLGNICGIEIGAAVAGTEKTEE
ncbi:MAG: ribosomal L7Ae/L30e/S12e/Gadd45 family protein [Anaerovoracaceae bacterium]